MGSYENFVKAVRQQAEAAPPTTAAPHGTASIGLDPASFETFETVARNPTASAAAIVKAAKTRDAGGPMAAKMSDAAQAIIDAGAKRRAGG
jgi:phospholipase/lecithinase/hemolysin